MDIKEKLEARMLFNRPFLEVFDYIRFEESITQEELAKRIRCASSLISAYRNGQKKVTRMMAQRLVNVSPEAIDINYIMNKSSSMFLGNNEDVTNVVSESSNYDSQDISKWADSLLYTLTEQIRQNEELNRNLNVAIARIDALSKELSKALNALQKS